MFPWAARTQSPTLEIPGPVLILIPTTLMTVIMVNPFQIRKPRHREEEELVPLVNDKTEI